MAATLQGTSSPLASIEPYLIEVILQLAQTRCTINATTGLHLVISLIIEGTQIADDLYEWKLKHNI